MSENLKESTLKPLVTGVVGLAAGVNLQCYQFKRIPECYSMKWLCDLDAERVEDTVAEYGGRGTNSFKDVIADPEVDLVTIATPTSTHVSLAIEALNAGKHVLVEKPVAASIEEAEELAKAAEVSKGRLCVDHERRYFSNQKTIEKLLDNGELGEIVSVILELPLVKTRENADSSTWTQRFLKSHIYDYLVHHVDQIMVLLGEKPSSVFCRARCLKGDDIPCEMEISLIMSSGILASVDLRHSHAPDCKWMVNCEKGSIRMKFHNDMSNCYVYQKTADGTRNVRELFPIKTSQEAYLDFYRDLYKALTEKTSVPVSLEDATVAIKVIWLAIESAESGETIKWR